MTQNKDAIIIQPDPTENAQVAGFKSERWPTSNRNPRPASVGIHRLLRTVTGLTQGGLGGALGLTFQQVQKYESGANRISASRLFEISRLLAVPITYFFDDMPEEVFNAPVPGWRTQMAENGEWHEPLNNAIEENFDKLETLELVRAYCAILDLDVRRRAFNLMKSLSPRETET